jgi:acetyl esterase/lipase
MALVREHAVEWGIAPDHIGFLGFSAGAMVPSHVALEAPQSMRPNFVAPIYGAPFGRLPAAPSSMPPVFLAYSSDDPLSSLIPPLVQAFYAALRKAGHHPELHIFRDSGHGYGLNKQGLSSDFWIEDFYNWLRSLGLTQRAVAPAP